LKKAGKGFFEKGRKRPKSPAGWPFFDFDIALASASTPTPPELLAWRVGEELIQHCQERKKQRED